MAWEKRGNKRYYYRKKRIGKRVVSEYFGDGATAELIALLDEEDRLEREYERQQFRREKETQLELDREIDALGDMVRAMTRASLVANGYYTHKGHSWRSGQNTEPGCPTSSTERRRSDPLTVSDLKTMNKPPSTRPNGAKWKARWRYGLRSTP